MTPTLDFVSNPFENGLPLHTEDLGRLPAHVMTAAGVGASGFGSYALGAGYSDNLGPYFQDPSPFGGFDGGFEPSADMGIGTSTQVQAAIAMFNGTPGGDQWDDWGAYIASVDELLRSWRSEEL
ncbi:hypothetical protein BT96DRAFT_990477 [Gymnopus androsaceus JB14]|uniref:Uncharacterized protein n=1 Tax=Gymnopus androsaceus JB14 TaxID=1447944 RepID=A0A6A4HXH4_9AGAR|nr:hypothetical protein BT96DRAFT_990477 [Gymnopus androsaceus JB14]